MLMNRKEKIFPFYYLKNEYICIYHKNCNIDNFISKDECQNSCLFYML